MQISIPTISQFKQIALRTLALTLLVGIATNAASGQVVFDDAVDGNASSIGSSPTTLGLNFGSNIVNGTVTSPSNIRNFYNFTIGAGQQLSAINLDAINVTDESGDVSLDPGFYALIAGSTGTNPADGFANLGGALYDPSSAGINLLDAIGSGGISGGTGFETIGPGDFTFVIQQTGPEVSNFSLDFQVVNAVPEPSSAVLLAGLGVVGMIRRRRR